MRRFSRWLALACVSWQLGCGGAVSASALEADDTDALAARAHLTFPASEAAKTEQAFLKQFAAEKGVDPSDTFVLTKRIAFDSQHAVARYRQLHHGAHVIGGGVVLHLNQGKVAYANGDAVSKANIDPSAPVLDVARATNLAQQHLAGLLKANPADLVPHAAPSLVYVRSGKTWVPAHRVILRTGARSGSLGTMHVDIDARTGAVLSVVPRDKSGVGAAAGTTVYDGRQSFPAQFDGPKATLRNGTLHVLDASPNPTAWPYAGALEYTSPTANFPAAATNGVSAFWGLSTALNYWLTYYQMACPLPTPGSVPAASPGEVPAFVNIVDDNLRWSPDHHVFEIGRSGEYLGVLDLLGHESTHCVIDGLSLDLPQVGEGAALEESFGDIFGMVIETNTHAGTPDWNVGGQLPSADGMTGFFRRLDNPKLSTPAQPNTYGGTFWGDPTLTDAGHDFGFIHRNGGVQNYWFYLLAQGGQGTNDLGKPYKVKGVGLASALGVAWHNLIGLNETASYNNAALLAPISAGEMCGDYSQEAISAQDAFYAVGLGTPASGGFFSLPSAGATGVDAWPVTFEWKTQGVNEEKQWQIEVSEDPNFNVVTWATGTQETGDESGVAVAKATATLAPKTHYYWRVRPFPTADSVNFVCWRPPQEFTTGSKTPTLISPTSGTQNPWDLEFHWSSVPGATSYTVQVATKSTFSPGSLIFPDVHDSSTRIHLSVKINDTLFWRVLAERAKPEDEGALQAGDWSKTGTFKTSQPKVSLIAPVSPAAVVGPWPVTFVFSKVAGADHYLLESSSGTKVSKGASNFKSTEVSQPKEDTLLVSKEMNFPADKPDDGHYYHEHWRVRVIGPPPLWEEGTPDDAPLVIDAKSVQPVLVPVESCVPVDKPLTFQWKRVPSATRYRFHRQPIDSAGGSPGTGVGINRDKDQLTYTDPDSAAPPSPQHFDGYQWQVNAYGPEGYTSMGRSWQSYWIKPVPVSIFVIQPQDVNINDLPGGKMLFQWRSKYAPKGEYRWKLWESATGYPSCDEHNYGNEPLTFQQSGTFSTEPKIRANNKRMWWNWEVTLHDPPGCGPVKRYCDMFHVAPAPPTKPAVPKTINLEGGFNEWMVTVFTFVNGADSYDIEQLDGGTDPSNHSHIGQSLGTTNYTADAIFIADNELYAAHPGTYLPPPWHVALVKDKPITGYQWRVRACRNGHTVCSDWSGYNFYWQGLQIPWTTPPAGGSGSPL